MGETTPFLASIGNPEFQWVSCIHLTLIQSFSVLHFVLWPLFDPILVLSDSCFYFLAAFLFNVVVEDDVFMYLVNSLLSVSLSGILLQHWPLKAILTFSLAVGTVSNDLVWLLFYVCFKTPTTLRICGSLSSLVALSSAIVYSSRSRRQKLASFSALPSDIFLGTGIWALLCIRSPPLATFSALLAVPISYLVLVYGSHLFGFPKNEDFSLLMSFRAPIATPDKITPAIGSFETGQKRDHNSRALLALEERLTPI
jgi:hypothetical protein